MPVVMATVTSGNSDDGDACDRAGQERRSVQLIIHVSKSRSGRPNDHSRLNSVIVRWETSEYKTNSKSDPTPTRSNDRGKDNQ